MRNGWQANITLPIGKMVFDAPSLCYNHRYKIDTQPHHKSCIFKNSSRKWPLLVKKCVYLHKTNRTTPKSSCRYTNGGTNNGQETSKTM